MKILIIGGTGTISKGIADAAVLAGHEVTLLNRGNSSFRNNKKCEVINGDINKTDELDLKIGFFDVIVDPITFSVKQLKERFELYKKHCKLYVFISSVAAIGSGEGVQDETSKRNPIWRYGVDKLECEEFLRKQNELNYIIQRPSITYGDIRIPIPVSCRKNPYTVIDRIINDRPLVCFNLTDDEKHKHKLMDVSDFGKYSVALLDKDVAINNDYIICADNAYSWKDAYKYLYAKLNKPINVYEVDRESFKILNPSLYEDIVYDKDCENVLFIKDKCKNDTNLNLNEKGLQIGVNDLVEYLEKEYKHKPFEEEYNLMTDYILLHFAQRDERLNRYLGLFTDKYIQTLNQYYVDKSIEYKRKNSKIRKLIKLIQRVLRKLK